MRELEAAIEANPDDVEAYYVYGDWLQQQGDPRGELVALQAAQRRNPSDKRLAHRVDKFIDKHADALLGGLHDRRGLVVDWRFGFIRDVQIEDAAYGDVLELVRELVQHPSGRFIQSLTFTSRSLDADALIELLLAERRPLTLAELRVGRGLDEAQLQQLREVFPRLNRSLEVEWRTIGQAIGKLRKSELGLDAAKLPQLESLAEASIRELDIAVVLRGLKHEIAKAVPLGVIAALKRTFTAESLDCWACELARQRSGRATASTRWVHHVVTSFGGAHTAAWIAESIVGWSEYRGEHAISLLESLESDHALLELTAIALDPKHERTLRRSAEWALRRRAVAAETTVDELLDRAIPAVPTPRAQEAIVRRLRAHLIDGRRMTGLELGRYIATHPAMAPLAERVVWATYRDDRVAQTFRITGERAVGRDGGPIDLFATRVGLVHPAELPAGERVAIVRDWHDAFEALAIEPLFSQLDRPVHDDPAALTPIEWRSAGLDHMRAVLERQRGWGPTYSSPEYKLDGWEKLFARGGVIAQVQLEGDRIARVLVRHDTRLVDFATLHPVVLSELVDDLDAATSAPGRAAVDIAVESTIDRGTRVRIVRGAGRGKYGVVFWLGDGKSGDRCGVRGDDGETYWANLAQVVLEGAPDPDKDAGGGEPVFANGNRVSWTKGHAKGTGTVFWIGKNKFGDGMRVGIKPDDGGESVWANAEHCALEPQE